MKKTIIAILCCVLTVSCSKRQETVKAAVKPSKEIVKPVQYEDGPKLIISITDESGKPLSGIRVWEGQLNRDGIYEKELGFSDNSGKIEVLFKDGPTSDLREFIRGYGVFRFSVLPDQYVWQLSDKYIWADPKGNPEQKILQKEFYEKKDNFAKECNTNLGKVVELSKRSSIIWPVVLKKAKAIKMKVVDKDLKALPNENILAFIDLECNSHVGTWNADGCFSKKLLSDSEGFIEFDNPGDVYYTFNSSKVNLDAGSLNYNIVSKAENGKVLKYSTHDYFPQYCST